MVFYFSHALILGTVEWWQEWCVFENILSENSIKTVAYTLFHLYYPPLEESGRLERDYDCCLFLNLQGDHKTCGKYCSLFLTNIVTKMF